MGIKRQDTTVAKMLDALERRDLLDRVEEAGQLSLPVVWNSRLRTSAGRCRGTRAAFDGRWYPSRIELNPRLFEEGEEAIAKTFLHELAHALAPGDKHGPKWKAVMRAIGEPVERCHSYDSMSPAQKVVAVCDTCGHPLSRTRRLARGRRYMHRGCGGMFIRTKEIN